MIYLVVDGMLNGTGIRDKNDGSSIDLENLQIGQALRKKIKNWLRKYEEAHYFQYENIVEVESLDKEGQEITNLLKKELPNAKVSYFSSALMRMLS